MQEPTVQMYPRQPQKPPSPWTGPFIIGLAAFVFSAILALIFAYQTGRARGIDQERHPENYSEEMLPQQKAKYLSGGGGGASTGTPGPTGAHLR